MNPPNHTAHAGQESRSGDVQSKESQLTLELLQAIEQRDDVSQRYLAQQLGVALGLANAYLKRCVKKGWIKVSTAPANRYLYYLTPKGFAEKARLTTEFFSTSFALFRQAGDEYTVLLQLLADRRSDMDTQPHVQARAQCQPQSEHQAQPKKTQQTQRLLFIGLSDLTEIALMRALQANLPVVGVYQPGAIKAEFFGVPVLTARPAASEFEVAVLTSMEQTAELLHDCEQWVAGADLSGADLSGTEILVPPMLLTMRFRVPAQPSVDHAEPVGGQPRSRVK